MWRCRLSSDDETAISLTNDVKSINRPLVYPNRFQELTTFAVCIFLLESHNLILHTSLFQIKFYKLASNLSSWFDVRFRESHCCAEYSAAFINCVILAIPWRDGIGEKACWDRPPIPSIHFIKYVCQTPPWYASTEDTLLSKRYEELPVN